jgi:hypothetical protein
VILFALYAMLVWYLAARWRRRPLGIVVVLTGAGAAAMGGWLAPDALISPDVRVLLKGEAGIILLVGLLILAMPRRDPVLACAGCGAAFTGVRRRVQACERCGTLSGHCEYCGYTLTGLPSATIICPECGTGRDGSSFLPPGSAPGEGTARAPGARPRLRTTL